ncbi:hypothetical protein AGMMS50267_14280 [Spirochaetia bacterium]|nr:hypothetical protein AGMMS50267_14280 [Spirochaetia bacterium]
MTPTQKQAALNTAIDTLTRLLETAPPYSDLSVSLTLHAGEVCKVSESLTRTLKPGAQHA